MKGDNQFKRIVCPLLQQYTRNTQKSVILSILSQAYSVSRGNLSEPILGIIIGAALRVCGYEEEGLEKIKLALLGLILGGAILWATSSLGSKRKSTKKEEAGSNELSQNPADTRQKKRDGNLRKSYM